MIDLTSFKGEIPKVSDRLLPTGYAAEAKNCDLDGGNLQAMKGTTFIQDVAAGTQTIFKMASSFLAWGSVVDVVRSLVADSGNRMLFSGAGYPKETNEALALASPPFPTYTRRLGIPAPTNALTVTLTGSAGSEVACSSSYVYTIAGKWEDGSEVESAPSPPTGVFEIYEGVTPTLTGFVDSSAEGVFTTHFRIYRLNAGNTGAEYQYVDEIYVTESRFDDLVDANDLAEVVPSTYWTSPDEALEGLTATSHGLVFGFKGNTIYPSDVFTTYAYPDAYSLVTESDIVGLGYTGSLVAVLTKTVPYMLLGQDPATLSLQRLGYQQPCVSARSVANIPGGLIYASADGLFRINEAGEGALLTVNLFTKKQWKALGPENLIGVYYDQSYYGFVTGSTTGFRLDLVSGDYRVFELAAPVYGVHYSPEADALYLIVEMAAGRKVVAWGNGPIMDYTWASGEISFSAQKIFTAGMVQGDFSVGDATMMFYVDGLLVHSKSLESDNIFRIPPVRGNVFQVKLEGKATIHRVLFGESVAQIVREVN
ncbi:hypothetical protein [Desulfobacter sp.]|uniref:hypothetical protein n=1 Tax=Desulfobacter sp. TaxID=2294 RepID=UPI003D0B6CC5